MPTVALQMIKASSEMQQTASRAQPLWPIGVSSELLLLLFLLYFNYLFYIKTFAFRAGHRGALL